jgi:hypothetical protein
MATRRTRTRALAATATGLLVGLALGAPALADVRRCEDSAGRVTYSNQTCPSGTAKERAVEQRPAVEVPREGSAGPATHEGVVKQSTAASAAGDRTPERSREISREQNKAQVARCDDLVRRIEYGQQDLLTTTGTERASVELSLRRLQDEHQANCAARH